MPLLTNRKRWQIFWLIVLVMMGMANSTPTVWIVIGYWCLLLVLVGVLAFWPRPENPWE